MKTFRLFSAAVAATLALAMPRAAEDHPRVIHIHDAQARAMGGVGKSGAVFFTMHNNTETGDRLVDARADVAQRVELHTHKDMGDGVMKMMHVPEGFARPAGEMHECPKGDSFSLTLFFEQAGEVVIDVTVDNDRKPMAGSAGNGHDHGAMHGMAKGG